MRLPLFTFLRQKGRQIIVRKWLEEACGLIDKIGPNGIYKKGHIRLMNTGRIFVTKLDIKQIIGLRF